MDRKKDLLLGYCGLYCGNCLFYQNTVKGTGTDMGDGVYIECHGCESNHASPWCTECALKACCREKRIRTCIECGEYPCEALEEFINSDEYPYHKEVPGMMERLSEIGLAAWAEEMERRYTCATCGERFTYFDGTCPRCAER